MTLIIYFNISLTKCEQESIYEHAWHNLICVTRLHPEVLTELRMEESVAVSRQCGCHGAWLVVHAIAESAYNNYSIIIFRPVLSADDPA